MDGIVESDPSDDEDDEDDDEAPKISSAMASRKVTRAMYQKLSAAHYQSILLLSFQTSEKVRRCTLEVATDATPAEDFITFQEMKIRSSTARAMLAYDRDVNAAKNNFHKNMSLLG
ncbi:hypothetical protein V7S43_015349 [Phytophthora oleae]|uniref:Uncharacterized protein n=1 Tax=Phytophthora oleae TaxID=2107226 RepID=A0ABD3F3H9_9STRA